MRYFQLGESGLGKSTLINTLFNTTLYPPKEVLPPSADRPKTVAIESISAGVFIFPPFQYPLNRLFIQHQYRHRRKWCPSSVNSRRHSWIWGFRE